jgi:hypothetical protein
MKGKKIWVGLSWYFGMQMETFFLGLVKARSDPTQTTIFLWEKQLVHVLSFYW